jgi:hypothetical protein
MKRYAPTINNKSVLLGILQSYAPTSKEQLECANDVWHLESQGARPIEVERFLIYAIADGLRYGDWPWTKDLEE